MWYMVLFFIQMLTFMYCKILLKLSMIKKWHTVPSSFDMSINRYEISKQHVMSLVKRWRKWKQKWTIWPGTHAIPTRKPVCKTSAQLVCILEVLTLCTLFHALTLRSTSSIRKLQWATFIYSVSHQLLCIMHVGT